MRGRLKAFCMIRRFAASVYWNLMAIVGFDSLPTGQAVLLGENDEFEQQNP